MKTLNVVNLPRVICEHLYGENHSHGHRMVVGVFIAIIGVLISKAGVVIHILHIPLDVLGYGIHGMGFVPFIDYYQAKGKESPNPFKCKTEECKLAQQKKKEYEKEYV